MTITEVQFVPIKPKDGQVGFASCVVNDSLYLGSIAVFSKLSGGYRIVFPTKKVGSRNFEVYHPINVDTHHAITDAVTQKVEEILT